MRVLVTGAAGFVGSHLCDRLLAEGHAVVGMDNFLTGHRRNIAHLAGRSDFEFIEHDVTVPFDVPGAVDLVLHFASPASPIDYIQLPLETLMVGSYGTHNTLELARRREAGYLLASTSEVYGDPEVHPQPETYWGHVSSIGPRSVYDEAKRYAEAAVMAYYRKFGMNTHIVRIFNSYGARMRLNDGRVVPNFVAQAIQGLPLTIYGDGKQTRSFQYYSDLVEGVYRLAQSDEHEPVNIGTQFELSVRDFAELINRLTGNTAGVVYEPSKRIQDDPQQRKADNAKALRVLGWQPQVSLEDGLRETIAWFRAHVFNS
jgi:dTDP-glucose 4,6-dehydratase